jgi:hypothetical protein
MEQNSPKCEDNMDLDVEPHLAKMMTKYITLLVKMTLDNPTN